MGQLFPECTLEVDDSTLNRWVLAYISLMQKQLGAFRKHIKPPPVPYRYGLRQAPSAAGPSNSPVTPSAVPSFSSLSNMKVRGQPPLKWSALWYGF